MPAEPQGIPDYRDRTEAHGGGSDHRAQQQTECRIEQTGSERDAKSIIDEGEKQVLPDIAHRRLRQFSRADDAAEIAAARHGHSADVKADAAVSFARKVAELRGKVSDADLAQVREAGFSDAQVIEIVTNVALNTLTNLVNNVARTDIDFPVVSALAA